MDVSDPKSARKVILDDFRSTVSYAKDILQLLSSEDLLNRANSRVEVMNEIRSEMDESTEHLAGTTKALESKLHDVEESIAFKYEEIMGEGSSRPDLHKVREEMRRVSKKTKKIEEDLLKLENEKKILDRHKKQCKIQRSIVDVKFDLGSSKTNPKGYIRKPSGDYQTFQFDLNKDSFTDIADFLWDLV